jgi:hypothetical protein
MWISTTTIDFGEKKIRLDREIETLYFAYSMVKKLIDFLEEIC